MRGGRAGPGERPAARAVWPGLCRQGLEEAACGTAVRVTWPDQVPGAVSPPAGYEVSAGGCSDATAGYGRPLAAGRGHPALMRTAIAR